VEIGTPESSRHFVAREVTQRQFFEAQELQPHGATASVVVEHADGTHASVEMPWTVVKGGIAGAVLVLHDELSGSCAEACPKVLQSGGIVKTFGARTMGLGGTVEPVATLQFSRATLILSRGLNGVFGRDGVISLIENAGVTPDYPYKRTIADYRGGHLGYVTAFSQVASTLQR
jgi:C-terminal processing protease CtpA/Prc